MKKGKFFIVGLVALLMAGGLVFASCDNENVGVPNCPKGKNDCRDYQQETNCWNEDCIDTYNGICRCVEIVKK
jgi:hypothetical protein